MKRGILLLLAIFLFIGGTVSAKDNSKSPKVLKFDLMVGVSGSFQGTTNSIRGISGGGLPWILSKGEGKLSADGKIKVEVEGLIIPGGLTPVPNPVPFFKAIVSCLSIDEGGNALIINVETGLFPASELGDSKIKDTVELPNPCIAPIIFVTAPSGVWFAATGF